MWLLSNLPVYANWRRGWADDITSTPACFSSDILGLRHRHKEGWLCIYGELCFVSYCVLCGSILYENRALRMELVGAQGRSRNSLANIYVYRIKGNPTQDTSAFSYVLHHSAAYSRSLQLREANLSRPALGRLPLRYHLGPRR